MENTFMHFVQGYAIITVKSLYILCFSSLYIHLCCFLSYSSSLIKVWMESNVHF